MAGPRISKERGSFMASRKRLKTIFKPLVIVVADVYFVIDALALSVLKPLLRKIANVRLFAFIARWIASLSPYATLALFLIPLILLEPVKPLSAYLVASGQFKLGMFVLSRWRNSQDHDCGTYISYWTREALDD